MTDLLYVKVKFKQIVDYAFTLRAILKGAKDQFNGIVGQYPDNIDFALPDKPKMIFSSAKKIIG